MAVLMLDRTIKRKLRFLITIMLTGGILYSLLSFGLFQPKEAYVVQKNTLHIVYDRNQKEYTYDKSSPVIFIGGVPRSGTTLMRAMLDAHPDVRCGEETHVIPSILQQRNKWINNPGEKVRLLEAGIDDDVMDDAISAFMLEIMAKHGEPAKRLCNKDPFVLLSISYLRGVFPNGRYILMIRDGRATVHSIISRQVGITGYNITSYRDCLIKWNRAIEKMYNQCLLEGMSICLPVYYEKLIFHPEEWMRHILEFLDIPWDDAVLHHEDAVGKTGGISLSKKEKSTDQVVHPINRGALTKWVGHIPPDVQADIDIIAPMLFRLGYDPHAKYPKYGQDKEMIQEDKGMMFETRDEHNIKLQELQQRQVKWLYPWNPPAVVAKQ